MNTGYLAAFLGWSTVINYSILILSTVMLLLFKKRITRIHSSLFGLDEPDLRQAYFQYLAQYKIAIFVLNLTPYLALRCMV